MDEMKRNEFSSDPLGYGASARLKWGMAQTAAGYPADITKPATTEELKDPILWLSHAHALSQSAVNLIKSDPDLSVMPIPIRASCDCQYRAVALMLVGYSLEISLKAMMIVKEGIDEFLKIEKTIRHHRLEDLANFVPNLSEKDRAILRALTHYVYWAGRYPDPGLNRSEDLEEIFNISEKYKVTANDLFTLSSRVMGHANVVANQP
jgi:hypothetical protein